MPPDAPAPAENAAPAPVAENGSPISTSGPKPRGAALIAKHVAIADKARAEEARAELAKTDPSLAGSPTERERDPKTGHFLPAGAKPKPKSVAAPAQPTPTSPKVAAETGGDTTKKPDEPVVGGGLGKAREMVRDGKIADALKLIGLSPDKLEAKQWAAFEKQNKAMAQAVLDRTAQVEAKEREVQQSARQLVNDLAPFIRGKQAFDKGDYEEAFQQCFGLDLNTFQRKALQSMTQPGMGKDPVVLELRQQNQLLQQKLDQFITGQQTAAQEQQLQARRQAAWNGNVQALADSGDPKMAQLAQNPKFMNMVWRVQGEHYDATTDSTLPALEAAELAMERLQSEFSEWQPVFGGGPPARVTGAQNPVAGVTGAANPVRRTARAVTTLNPSEAAEAAPRQKLRGRALIDYHANLAKMAELRGDLNGQSS